MTTRSAPIERRSPAPTGVRRLAAAVWAGALAGATIGGIGGRLAMLLLRLTSDPSLRGRLTDDGFTIGVVSTETIFLLVLTTVGGAIGGAFYLAIRSWLPKRSRPWVAGALAGLVGGAGVLRPGGIDFTLLEPLGLAVAMFVAIPAGYGVATSLLCERLLRNGSPLLASRVWFAPLVFLLPIGLSGPIGLLLVATILLVALIPRLRGLWISAVSPLGPLWLSTAAAWIGLGVLLSVAGTAFLRLQRDIAAIL